MAAPTILKCDSTQGIPLKACICPYEGLFLSEYVHGETPILKAAYLIGPHFKSRHPSTLFLSSQNEEGSDLFPDGICRYVPWKIVQQTESEISAVLSGETEWEGSPLKTWQGQMFEATCRISLNSEKLQYDLTIISETDSLIGCEMRFSSNQDDVILSDLSSKYYENGILKEIPLKWQQRDEKNQSTLSLTETYNHAFRPYNHPLIGNIILRQESHDQVISFSSNAEECSWHLFKPEKADEFSIRPISSQNPWRPNLTVSRISISIALQSRKN
ncbi:MAG: hypothetical protein Tsb0021_10500 [Chlamydiales bacterium]